MGRKSRQKRAPDRAEHSPAAAASARRSTVAPRTRFSRSRWTRLVISIAVPLLLFAAAEGLLRLFGYGYSTNFFEESGDGKTLTTNWKFAWQFYPRKTATSPTPILFPKEKTPGTKRIFILGESAAAGTPDPAFGFARMLDLMLRDQYPGNRIEVLNVAMRGIDSHIVRQIAGECARLTPDLFVVYMGNNDMIGLHSPTPGEFVLTSSIHWIRFKHALRRLKLAQAMESLLTRVTDARAAKAQDQEFFRRNRLAFDDPRRERVYQHYEINLREICAMAQAANAQAIVCTVAANLRDFPPLASLHHNNLSADQLAQWEKLYAEGNAFETVRSFPAALASYEQAARIDDHFAELLFRMARCHEALGKNDDARRLFAVARDWDAMQFRTDGRINNIVKSVGTNGGANIRLADIEARCAESPLAQNGVCGSAIFQEHVHFRFEGDHVVASALMPEVAAALSLPPPAKPMLSRDDCADQLAYTAIDDFNVRSAIARLISNPPFLDQLEHPLRRAMLEGELKQRTQEATTQMFERAVAIYQRVVETRPDDWMVRFNFSTLLNQVGNKTAALGHLAEVVKRVPMQRAFRVAYGNALLEAGQAREAVAQFEAALKLDPELKPARQGLAAARSRLK
jgi:tetratricopeptide (TPR) repeat protein